MPAGKHSSGKKTRVGGKGSEGLNENQARRLRVTCQHIDRVLCEIESAMDEASSATAFPMYIQDLCLDQQQVIGGTISGIRKRLVDFLEGQEIAQGNPQIPISRAIRARLYSIDISAEEIRPKHMKGFGKVSDAATAELDRIANDLQQTARYLDKMLDKKTGMDR